MQRRTDIARWLAATGITAALVVSSAVPATAAPAPTLGLAVADILFAPSSAGTISDVILLASEPVDLHNVVFTYDVSDIRSVADIDIEDPASCEISDDLVTCRSTEEMIDAFGFGFSHLALRPKAGAAVGAEGDLKVTVSADGIAHVSDTAKVTIGEGVNLAAEKAPDVTARPGGAFSELLGLQNVGAVTAHGAVVMFDPDLDIESGTKTYSNCTYDAGQIRMCEFDTDLLTDKSYGATVPFAVRSDSVAPGRDFVAFNWLTPAEWAGVKNTLVKLGLDSFIGKPGTGPALTLTEKAKGPLEPVDADFAGAKAGVAQADEDPFNNFTFSTITVSGKNPADVAAVGDAASGAAGAVVEVKIGVKNNGPAAITPNRTGDPFAIVLFTVPPGATVTGAPSECFVLKGDQPDWEHPGKAGGAKYMCPPGMAIPVGTPILFAFKLRITTVTPDAKGKVEIVSAYFREGDKLAAEIDANPNNDVAYLVLNGNAAPSPSSGGGGLPITGTPVALVAAVGLALALAGLMLYRAARRRRLTEV
jgi:hypothetical protein